MFKQNFKNNDIIFINKYDDLGFVNNNLLKYLILINDNYRIFKAFFFFLVLIIIIYLKLLIEIKLKNIKELKICLCTLGKKENNYANEFVEHYKQYGIDKIFIYDNNEKDGEVFDSVLSNYINNEYVKIVDYRGKNQIQINMLNDCYKKNYKKYDWIIMFDMDEFIYLKNFKNIKFYIINKKFSDCEVIFFNRVFHTDNNQIYYKNKTLAERFPESVHNILSVKPILRGHISNLNITDNHLINSQIKYCNGFGQNNIKKPDFKYYYIDHYYFKSTEEFIEKLNKGDCYYNNTNDIKMDKIEYYFKSNKLSLKKINYIEEKTGINLTKFRQMIK